MFASILFSLLPVATSIVFVIITATIQSYQKRKSENRWSPLTSKLLRSPGYQLVKALDKINDEIYENVFLVFVVPIVVYAAHISTSYFLHQQESLFRLFLSGLMVITWETYAIRELIVLSKRKRRIREGYEAESAVGSELNQLMLDGALIYHDFPADNFNIDHIVISAKGVFCVETKSRAKYISQGNRFDAKVDFDGNALKFPLHTENAPVEQVRRNAKWLKEWLSYSAGEQIHIIPVIALPGWYINRKSTVLHDVIVINGKNPRPIFSKTPTPQKLSEEQIKRIAFQIDQRCRDVEPTQYRKSQGAFS